MSDPRVAFSVFCDDVRYEAGNKLSFMGIYGSDIIFSTPAPIVWPRLCVATWLICDVDDVPDKFQVRVYASDKKTVLSSTVSENQYEEPSTDDATKHWSRTIMHPTNIRILEEGSIHVVVDIDGKPLKAGRLRVRFAPKTKIVEKRANA